MSSTYLPPTLGESVHEVFIQMYKQQSICLPFIYEVWVWTGIIRHMSTLNMN